MPQAAFSPNTTISSAAVNSDFSDIASALTGSVAADGQTPITGVFKFAAGSATNPPLTFTIDTTSGFYLIAAGNPGITAGGVEVLSLTSTGGSITGTLGVSSDFAVNTNKFTVAASTGNTAIAGTLSVTGTCTFTTPLATANYAASSVTYAKIQNETNNTLLGNFSGGAAAPSEYTLGDNLAVISTTLNTKYGPKAWASCTVSGGVVTLTKSFNISSITRNAQGDFTINFTNPMTDTGYVVSILCTAVSGTSSAIPQGKPAGTYTVNAYEFYVFIPGTGTTDPGVMMITVFGN